MRPHQMMNFAMALVLLGSISAPAAKKRDWKEGIVRDQQAFSDAYSRGSVSSRDSYGNVHTRNKRVEVTGSVIAIEGGDYGYFVQDARERSGALIPDLVGGRKSGCRFIVGDKVRYAQEKSTMNVLDADGKECRLRIIRQQRLDAQ